MANKHDSTCLQNAGDKEPIFVLRAQDVTAPDIIRMWAALNWNTLPSEKHNEAMQVAKEMEAWPNRRRAD